MSSHREDQIRETLEAIRKKNKGRLTRQAVVAYAKKNKESILGRLFNWNEEEAALAHWLDRAQEIISRYVTVVVVDRSMKIRVPYYVRDPSTATNEGGYVATTDRHSRADATTIIVNEMERVIGAISRARDVAFVLNKQHHGISEHLQRMLVEAVTMRDRLAA